MNRIKDVLPTMENIAKYLTLKSLENQDEMVTVILPVYNRIDTVKSSIESVLNQSYRNFELIVVDDGSDDGSKELLESLKEEKITLLHNATRKGVSTARNRGLEVAKGKYVAYLDSDNLWDSQISCSDGGGF